MPPQGLAPPPCRHPGRAAVPLRELPQAVSGAAAPATTPARCAAAGGVERAPPVLPPAAAAPGILAALSAWRCARPWLGVAVRCGARRLQMGA